MENTLLLVVGQWSVYKTWHVCTCLASLFLPSSPPPSLSPSLPPSPSLSPSLSFHPSFSIPPSPSPSLPPSIPYPDFLCWYCRHYTSCTGGAELETAVCCNILLVVTKMCLASHCVLLQRDRAGEGGGMEEVKGYYVELHQFGGKRNWVVYCVATSFHCATQWVTVVATSHYSAHHRPSKTSSRVCSSGGHVHCSMTNLTAHLLAPELHYTRQPGTLTFLLCSIVGPVCAVLYYCNMTT